MAKAIFLCEWNDPGGTLKQIKSFSKSSKSFKVNFSLPITRPYHNFIGDNWRRWERDSLPKMICNESGLFEKSLASTGRFIKFLGRRFDPLELKYRVILVLFCAFLSFTIETSRRRAFGWSDDCEGVGIGFQWVQVALALHHKEWRFLLRSGLHRFLLCWNFGVCDWIIKLWDRWVWRDLSGNHSIRFVIRKEHSRWSSVVVVCVWSSLRWDLIEVPGKNRMNLELF